MNNASVHKQVINTKINELQGGYCLLVKLLNYDELKVLSLPIPLIIESLSDILHKICKQKKLNYFIYSLEPELIILLPNIGQEVLDKIIYDIYSKTQLYTNESFREVYLNCCISSLKLTHEFNNIEEIYKQLLAQIINRKENQFNCPYTSKYSPASIKEKNYKLAAFRKAVEEKTIKFAYQPIIDRRTGEIPYYECLLRMPDLNGEFVSIGPIIEEAEKKGLINVIDRTVLTMAVNELNKAPDLNLSINISNIGILDVSLLKMAQKLLKANKVASRLIVEITETSLNNDLEWTRYFIDSLHELGCKFALDDFGSGFTSFRQLKCLPIDIIKIDGSYIRDILSNNYSQYFVQELIKISEELGIKTVAEFVENGEIAKFLIDIKIDGMQGNFFSPASSNINI